MNRAIQKLLVQLHNPDADKRADAIVGLRDFINTPEVRHAIRSCIQDPDGYVRMLAAEALSKADLFANDIIPVLMAMLEVTDQSNIAGIKTSKQWRRIAAGALAKYGPDAEQVIPLLRGALLDPDINIRGYAAIALGSICPPAIVGLQDLRGARQMEDDPNIREIYEKAITKIVQSDKFIVITEDEQEENG